MHRRHPRRPASLTANWLVPSSAPVLAVLLCCIIVAFLISRSQSKKNNDRDGTDRSHTVSRDGDIELASSNAASEDSRANLGHAAEDSRIGV